MSLSFTGHCQEWAVITLFAPSPYQLMNKTAHEPWCMRLESCELFSLDVIWDTAGSCLGLHPALIFHPGLGVLVDSRANRRGPTAGAAARAARSRRRGRLLHRRRRRHLPPHAPGPCGLRPELQSGRAFPCEFSLGDRQYCPNHPPPWCCPHRASLTSSHRASQPFRRPKGRGILRHIADPSTCILTQKTPPAAQPR